MTFSQAPRRQPPLSGVRQVLRQRRKPPEASRLSPGNGQSAVVLAQDVALQRLHGRLHPRKW